MRGTWRTPFRGQCLMAFGVLLSIMSGLFYFQAASVFAATTITAAHGTTAHPNVVYVNVGNLPPDKTAATLLPCQAVNAPVRCYDPRQIRRAYDVQPLLNRGITGKGKTIVIVDAFQSPTIQSDLRLFDQAFGLNEARLNIIAPFGLTPFDYNNTDQVGWAGEITLDVEWAHAIAPGATIDLVLAKSDNDADIENALEYAVSHNLGDVISQSFGEGEPCINPPSVGPAEHKTYQEATAKHVTLFASSGDTGAAESSQDNAPAGCNSKKVPPYFLSASTPASDPLVTAVGATYLNAALDGSYIGEAAWNDLYGASGGGYSKLFSRPSYQNGVVSVNQRGVPDVAYNGDVNGGVVAVWSSYAAKAQPRVFVFGGTSAGSPQWAGLIALADQLAGRRLGFINTAIYRIGESRAYSLAFHDTRVGNNTFVTTTSYGKTIVVPGYDTAKGWDAVTGWGTPDAAGLLPLLVLTVRAGDGAHL